MFKQILYLALIALIIFHAVDARKTRKPKRTKSEEDSTPQPNVVTYSTFGFNDVGTFDGFVPSSPDYVNYLNTFGQDSSTRLYAPAFPTAQDVSGFNTQSQDAQSYNIDDNVPQASTQHFPQSSMSYVSYNAPSSFDNEAPSHTFANEQVQFRHNTEENDNSPIYGAKLSSKNRHKEFNFTDYSMFSNTGPNTNNGKFSTSFEIKTTHENRPQSFGEPNKNYQNSYKYSPTFSPTATENFKTTQSPISFPKVIDFTKMKQYYPTEVEHKYPTATTNPSGSFHSFTNFQNENSYNNNFNEFYNNYNMKPTTSTPKYKDSFKKDVEEVTEKETVRPFTETESEISKNNLGYQNKNPYKDSKPSFDYKDKFKYNPWASVNYTNDFKNWNNPVKGYQYATNYSNMNFEFDLSGVKNGPTLNFEETSGNPKRPMKNNNNDEIVPASSNLDVPSYQFPESDFSSFKKFPNFKGYNGEEYNNILEALKPQGFKYDPEEYVRNLYGDNVPKITTQWGNVYKSPEHVSYKQQRPKRPQFADEINDDIVHIPRRPYSNKHSYGKYSDSKPNEWASYTRPQKSKRPQNDWVKDYPTKFKSEEDLLGLRTHDTSDPSYLPTYSRPFPKEVSSDYEYKKLAEKWRQSYLKAKYKNAGLHDYESIATEQKPIHVPIPKPYPIEVPHPVIVPVPQPYPVRVPIPKPVAVPVVHELKVPIEKPVPYPVVKKVPYPVEKLVPVHVEKEVAVPVMKPYPVPIPHIRPVFHHTKPREEVDNIDDEDDDYMPRPETSKKVTYAKRPRGSRTRTRDTRRPSRLNYSYSDRNRRRWPGRRPEVTYRTKYPTRASEFHSKPFRHHDDEDFDHDHSDYLIYCKRTGNC